MLAMPVDDLFFADVVALVGIVKITHQHESGSGLFNGRQRKRKRNVSDRTYFSTDHLWFSVLLRNMPWRLYLSNSLLLSTCSPVSDSASD